MRTLIVVLTLIVATSSIGFAQKKAFATSDSIVVKGNIKAQMVITPASLSAYKKVTLGNVVIKNHEGKPKDTLMNVRGVLLKDLLAKAELDESGFKRFSEFCIVVKCTDDYTVVYSWNELFNSPTGDATYIVTDKDGQQLSQMKDKIAIITPSDYNTGRRFTKSVSSIEIKRIQ
ncbi:molybdopterin-binding protein [Pinibacter soli]|uniref:Molybdopterin-binding protein n=1 Tax=Pinibacter soli TaxID=3044211 RepID=A0ABT6RDR4_9BACT|nr:molybdopterin-binding protein [Pinibacter soli]MDI3320541.1 molybdopterin-binding protein [Pinibacter soli]